MREAQSRRFDERGAGDGQSVQHWLCGDVLYGDMVRHVCRDAQGESSSAVIWLLLVRVMLISIVVSLVYCCWSSSIAGKERYEVVVVLENVVMVVR